MAAGELNLTDLELDQETFVALQRIQAEAAGSSDPHAVPAALAKAAYQVAHGKLHKRIRPGGVGSDNDLGVDPDSSSENKLPIPTGQTSSAMSDAGLDDGTTAESSSPKSGRRGLHEPNAWKQKKRQRGPSHLFVPDQVKVRVVQVLARSRVPNLRPPRASPAASKVLKDDRAPEIVDLTSDVEMSSSPEDSPQAITSAEKGSRDPVPPPTSGKTVPEAPAPVAEASSVTKKIPDSGPPSSPLPKATPLAVPGDEDEDQPHSAQASSLSAGADLRA
ncbi:hypothetical protein PC121_g17502 [Phytophthora cactorum]|nr:hypothetical protein PC120_g24461 [Phytophthora cactorum]KAG3052029.1 hypothetical protein PC121_g17502 [Phytophthora cactorum]